MSVDEVAPQLVTELGDVARSVADVFGVDMLMQVEQRIEPACTRLTAELCSDDDRVAAEAARTVMSARWPDDTAPPPAWWRTPVGRMVARSVGRDDAEAVTRSVAAAMLGISDGAIGKMLHRADHGLSGSGGLERHPDGGLTRSSVLARLAR